MTAAAADATPRAGEGHQAIAYCPYCSEETLFPAPAGVWECRSCLRAFSVTFHGLVSGSSADPITEDGDQS